jgi:hypothetical protein
MQKKIIKTAPPFFPGNSRMNRGVKPTVHLYPVNWGKTDEWVPSSFTLNGSTYAVY